MRSKRTLFVCALLTLIVGLLVMFPARVVYHQFAPAGFAMSRIEGTVWNGQAAEASINGAYVRDVTWSMRPLSLFTGKVSYQVSARPTSGFFDAGVVLGSGGAIVLSDLTASLPLQLFADSVGIPGLRGNANLRFKRVEIVDGLAVAADGVVQVENLIVPPVGREPLGSYEAELFTQNNGVTASIEDTDGVVDLAGSLQVKRDRSFEFLAQVVVTAKTPEGVKQQLSRLPPPNERGQQELRLEGIL